MPVDHTFGLKNIQLPIRVKQRSGELQHSVATIELQVTSKTKDADDAIDLLTQSLNDFSGDFSVTNYTNFLNNLQKELQSKSIKLTLKFPYFIEKHAPVTKIASLMEYTCIFEGESGDHPSFKLCVQVPVTTLCPCSKEISEAGAHNQRTEVTFCVKYEKFIWLEELIELVEASASCELYALLKRPDEKYVTEQAYNNPMFVEDVVRMVAVNASKHPDITWFSAGVESFESIHKHSAYAFVESDQM